MRYERKYKIEHLSKSAVEQAVNLHPAGFRKIFPNRQVNNIYFDTPDYQTGIQNIEGVNQRKKYRVRWYGEDLQVLKKPRFETKIKHNELGTKQILKLEDTQLSDLAQITSQINVQQQNRLLLLYPTLLNTYQRSYFGTADGKFRMTIDWDLHFYPPLHKTAFSQYPLSQKGVVLELKYEEAEDELANEIFRYLPFRQTKNSKYVTGLFLSNFI